MLTSVHKRVTDYKRAEREARIDALTDFHKPLVGSEIGIITTPVETLVRKIRQHELEPETILMALGKQALKVQKTCNPLTEVLIKEAREIWIPKSKALKSDFLPLAGMPVSVKDTFGIKGFDATSGYVKYCDDPFIEDSPIVKIIRDAGGYPYVKTNIPFTLLSFESYNDIWGRTKNPHKLDYTSGGSTGGESALLAGGGSLIGVGTDVAGSVRVPAHFSGIYSLKPTTLRFPKTGSHTSTPGQEGIPSVAGPMARSLADLTYFFRSVIQMKPWNYDCTLVEREYLEPDLPDTLTFGVIKTDGIVNPSPACARGLDLSVDALLKAGHKVVEFKVPEPLEALTVGAQLLCSDGIETAKEGMCWGETNDYGVERAYKWAHLPRFIRWIWSFIVEYWYGDKVWATLLRDFHKKTINERWRLVTRRESYRALFFEQFKKSGVDFLLTVPNATPALPHRGLYNSFSSVLYTFLFNIVDYPAGVLPVTKVDKKKDQLPLDFNFKKLNGVAKGAYMNYDANNMNGLPVGVQIVGRRYRDEDVLAAMQVLETALHKNGVVYKQLEV